MVKGKVYLVGAGPGDPELITKKGAALVKKADVIIYDYLVNRRLLKLARKGCEKISVASLGPVYGDSFSVFHQRVIDLLIKKARTYKTVLRLKSGDPFIFGRGGHEAEALSQAGIKYEVIPGVTSGIAAADLVKVPLTDRRFASLVTFVTGHEDPKKLTSSIDWSRISQQGTLVFYMGVENLPYLVKQLIKHGRKKTTPVLIVEKVSFRSQRITQASLKDIVARAKKRKVKPPAIIMVGEVISLRGKL